MLTFLRKIRRTLIESGSARKYLLYAIGEIALVVIGILIALQINNWNEYRKDRANERKLLLSLLVDFELTQHNLKEAIDYYQISDRWMDANINMFGVSENVLSESQKDTNLGTGHHVTRIIQGTLQSALNTENQQLIINDSLKALLTSFPSKIEEFNRSEDHVRHVLLNRLRPVLESYISLTGFLWRRGEKYLHIKERIAPSDFEGLLTDRIYQNALLDQKFTNADHLRILVYLETATREIIHLLRSELEKIP